MEEHEDDGQEWVFDEFPHELDFDEAELSRVRRALDADDDPDD